MAVRRRVAGEGEASGCPARPLARLREAVEREGEAGQDGLPAPAANLPPLSPLASSPPQRDAVANDAWPGLADVVPEEGQGGGRAVEGGNPATRPQAAHVIGEAQECIFFRGRRASGGDIADSVL